MLEKQGRDDGIKEKYGLGEEVDLGDEDVARGREIWVAGRERKGLAVDEPEVGESSVRVAVGTPARRGGKGKEGVSPSLVTLLRKTTAKKYDPFNEALEGFSTPKMATSGGLKVKGRIKDVGILSGLADGVKSIKAKVELESPREGGAMVGGLLAGYGSD